VLLSGLLNKYYDLRSLSNAFLIIIASAQVYRNFITKGGHDATCMSQLVITKARPGRVEATFEIQKNNGKLVITFP